MKSMEEYAKVFAQKNFGKGQVTKVTDYSFVWETAPKKESDKLTSCIYMLSYFL